MKRLLFILAVLVLFGASSACSSERELKHPIVLGAEPTDGPVNDPAGIKGSVKLNFVRDGDETFNAIDGGFHITTCNKTNEEVTYGITVLFATEVNEPGRIHLSYGLKTSQDEGYIWSTQPTNINVERENKFFMFAFAIVAPDKSDIYLTLAAVGGDSSGDHSSRHYDEYTPGSSDSPTINHEFCSKKT